MTTTPPPRKNSSGKVKSTRVTERSIFHWAFSGNFKLQLILLLVIILIVFARVLPLEMQKRVINDAIALKNTHKLILYCSIYIGAVTAASGLKLAINSLQAVIAERAITTMRKQLYAHILSLPLGFFRTTQPGMVVASLMTELSSVGTFAGMAFAVPVTNILTLVSFAAYLLWLNAELAVATMLIYPIVVFVVPILQKRANRANKARVDISRKLSSQVAESISGINEIQVHGAYDQEGEKFDTLAEKLQKIRIRWSLFKFGIKTTNNYFVGIGPFIIFIFGGYLVMQGELELGAMVAFLSAQEKLFDPWKELIEFYQTYQDASVRYTRTMQAFNIEPQFLLSAPAENFERPVGKLRIQDLFLDTYDGHRLLGGVSFELEPGEHLAVVGFSGSGKSTLLQCIGKMFPYTQGSITIDGRELSSWPKREAIKEIGYVSQQPFIFTGTIRENLLYARRAANDKDSSQETGTIDDRDRLILVLQQAGLFVDVMRFGLDTTIGQNNTETEERVIRMRQKFQQNFGEKLSDYIEFYDSESYHFTSPVAGNIIFGTSTNPQYSHQLLPNHEKFRSFLHEKDLFTPLLHLGVDLARQSVDILSGLDTVEIFFEKSPVPANQLERCARLLLRLGKGSPIDLNQRDQIFLLTLALQFTPSIHTVTRLPAQLAAHILDARKTFPEWSRTVAAPDLFIFYDRNRYIHGQSILNNILFGRVRPGMVRAQETISQSIMQLLIEEDFLEQVADIGMDHQVGNMGDNLSGGQRQKLAIARVLLKQPQIILMDEATSALDNNSQSRIQRLMSMRWKGRRTVIAVVHRLDIINTFDKVAVMKAGKIVELGTYQQLIDQEGILHELIYGRK